MFSQTFIAAKISLFAIKRWKACIISVPVILPFLLCSKKMTGQQFGLSKIGNRLKGVFRSNTGKVKFT
jgi:hypothetical protein